MIDKAPEERERGITIAIAHDEAPVIRGSALKVLQGRGIAGDNVDCLLRGIFSDERSLFSM